MKNYMSKYKIGKGSLIFDVEELSLVLGVHLNTKANTQNETGYARDESRQKGVEWKCSHKQTIHELKYSSEEYVRQIRIDCF